jgi:hypothetical protein
MLPIQPRSQRATNLDRRRLDRNVYPPRNGASANAPVWSAGCSPGTDHLARRDLDRGLRLGSRSSGVGGLAGGAAGAIGRSPPFPNWRAERCRSNGAVSKCAPGCPCNSCCVPEGDVFCRLRTYRRGSSSRSILPCVKPSGANLDANDRARADPALPGPPPSKLKHPGLGSGDYPLTEVRNQLRLALVVMGFQDPVIWTEEIEHPWFLLRSENKGFYRD